MLRSEDEHASNTIEWYVSVMVLMLKPGSAHGMDINDMYGTGYCCQGLKVNIGWISINVSYKAG